MIKAICLVFSLFVIPLQGHITLVSSMEEVGAYFEGSGGETLALFDVDMTLIQPEEPAFQMANMKRHGSHFRALFCSLNFEEKMVLLNLAITSGPSVVIDQGVFPLLEQLEDAGVQTMGLTASFTGPFAHISSMEGWRLTRLEGLGIDFSATFPTLAPIEEDAFVYRGGIAFVKTLTASKGRALIRFLEEAELHPKKVVFVDDRLDNLESVERWLGEWDPVIEYIGLHYLGAYAYPSVEVSEEEFLTKWHMLLSEVPSHTR